MSERRSPHFLRVVQALAFVSGLVPAAVVATNVTACSSTADLAHSDDDAGRYQGVVPYPGDDAGVTSDPFDGQVAGIFVPYDGQVLGVIDSGVVPYDGQVLGVNDSGSPPISDGAAAYDPDAGEDADVADAATDGHIQIGGPLYPPELPA